MKEEEEEEAAKAPNETIIKQKHKTKIVIITSSQGRGRRPSRPSGPGIDPTKKRPAVNGRFFRQRIQLHTSTTKQATSTNGSHHTSNPYLHSRLNTQQHTYATSLEPQRTSTAQLHCTPSHNNTQRYRVTTMSRPLFEFAHLCASWSCTSQATSEFGARSARVAWKSEPSTTGLVG